MPALAERPNETAIVRSVARARPHRPDRDPNDEGSTEPALTGCRGPDTTLERAFWRQGLTRVAGIDEAGRGAWAGPVAVAAVILPEQDTPWPYRDSKTLTPARRDELARHVREQAVAWAVAFADPDEIDRFNVLGATRRAALRAIGALQLAPDALVTDYLTLDTPLPFVAPPRADGTSSSVAAASLLAKTARDAFMRELDAQYPGYDFAAHKGYGAPAHRAALARLGTCPAHRRSFAPVAQAGLFDRAADS